MDKPRMHECTICGDEKSPGQVWFLVAESHWEDKLRVLEWQDQMATRQGIYAACSAAHVEELVIHWMTTGGLDYPFATVGHKPRSHKRKTTSFLPTIEEPDTRGARPDRRIGSRPGVRAARAPRGSRILASYPGRTRPCLGAGNHRRDGPAGIGGCHVLRLPSRDLKPVAKL